MDRETLSLKWLFFSLEGRIARKSFILSAVFLVLPQIIVLGQMINASQSGNEGALAFWFLAWCGVVLATLWTLIALTVKRLHDLDVTGWLGGYNLQWAWSSGYVAGMDI